MNSSYSERKTSQTTTQKTSEDFIEGYYENDDEVESLSEISNLS